MSDLRRKVVVVGAGPCGLLLALMLAQHGISVDVVEALDDLDRRPRGVAYGPAAVLVLKRAGLLDEVRSKGMTPKSLLWRDVGGRIIKGINRLDHFSDSSSVIYPVEHLSQLILDHISKQPLVAFHFGQKATSVSQDKTRAYIQTAAGQVFEGDFVVGCDGASSAVRKSLFGSSFPGITDDKMIVGTNVKYDFKNHGWEASGVSWIVDPDDFAVLCPINRDGVWRVSYGEEPGFTTEEYQKRSEEKLRRIIPGNPNPDQYDIQQFNPYSMHNRCVEHMAVDRIVLAGDAAHLCNPMGGLGLTTGLSDIGSLVDCFYGIYDGQADMDILVKYDEVRRERFTEVTDATSKANLKRVKSDPKSLMKSGNDPLFDLLDAAEKDPSLFTKLLQAEMRLSADLTELYTKA